MKAIGYYQSLNISENDALLDLTLDKPTVKPRDLLVEVKAISVNPVDTKIRAFVPPENGEAKVLGWDAVGTVVETGADVSRFKVGDEVWYAGDLTRPGSNAEFQCVDERIAALKPKTLSSADAAAMPLTSITAWELLFDRLNIERTDNKPANEQTNEQAPQASTPTPCVLIVGAAGGVGSILTQLAKQLTSVTVIGTASRPKSQEWVQSLGADHVINHNQPMQAQVEALNIGPVTHVISLTHTEDHFDDLIELLAPQGKFALIDDPKTPLDIMKMKKKSISLHWEFMYTRSMYETHDMEQQHRLLTEVANLIDQGLLKVTVGENLGAINAENLKLAHAKIETGQTVGKIVLEGF